ncbi:MAG: 1,4-alpha-glucan branching protein GlgB, partial [Acidimicrobiia bacterium]|nr:1,4-alpha-glucan branching protein GlgB [Acidimicrobiia bacterium]
MGLHRQWWVPAGHDPVDGVYVRQPARASWDEIAACSQRHGMAIVAEDLGTVPPEVREEMTRRRALGMFVAQSELHPRSASLARRPAARSVASFGTHDMPPIVPWWSAHGDDTRPVEAARDDLLAQLAASDAAIVLVDAGDVMLDPVQVNVPGTVDDRNWNHRMERTLAEVRADSAVSATLARIERFRHLPDAVGPLDLHLFNEGTHGDLATRFGARPVDHGAEVGSAGHVFSVWAPNARAVSVIGDAPGWDDGQPLSPLGDSGLWAGTVAHSRPGERYKFRVVGADGSVVDRADPLARAGEGSPGHASIIDEIAHEWQDDDWMASRVALQAPDAPMSIYELHLGSWRWHDDEGRPLNYREVAEPLAEYARAMGFTHVEFLPVMEHPFAGSWGYQVTGFFQPTARFGSPDDLRHLIDVLHRNGIGVLLDWVPAHFPADRFALAVFDGTELYEHADPREGVHPDWGSLIFNYGRLEVRSFLLSSACWWIESFHADGLRVDAVASMLYRDYSRAPGEWVPNRFGGRENLEAIEFLRACNDEIHRRYPGVVVAAEESTSWGGVTAPTSDGGLGFDLKWDLGWMHDTLGFLARDPIHRRWHQNELTFRQMYATSERFVLPLSHDEVVHGKGSLLGKMAGDEWQQRANLRLLIGWQHVLPGKKLLFMGGEFGQRAEWNHDAPLDWGLLDHHAHEGLRQWVARCNGLHHALPALHQLDHDPRGFEWISCDDPDSGVLVALRRGVDPIDDVVAVLNFTPTVRAGYRIGLPHPGHWDVEVSSDDVQFGGSGVSVPARIEGVEPGHHDRPWSASVTAVPLGVVLYRRSR